LVSSLFFDGSHRLYIDDYGMFFFTTVLRLVKVYFSHNSEISGQIRSFLDLVGYLEVTQVLLYCLTKQKRFGDVVFDQDSVEDAFRLSILVIVGFFLNIYRRQNEA
jgi:hypothetical protein